LADQQNEYQKSLQQDKQRELEREMELQTKLEAEERERKEKEAAEKREQQRIEEEKRISEELKSLIPPEPEEGSVAADLISNLAFRLPDGSKKQRKFLASTPLKALFAYLTVECNAIGKQLVVQTNFPKRIVSDLSPDLTLKEANLYPRETIFAQLS